jgi:hypothetical protein
MAMAANRVLEIRLRKEGERGWFPFIETEDLKKTELDEFSWEGAGRPRC